jgi:hypothetical protein
MANTTNTNVVTAADTQGLLTNARQDAIFAGYESSIYLPGQIMTVHEVSGDQITAQIPKFGAVATSSVSTETYDDGAPISELDLINVSNSAVNVVAQTYAARALVKDLSAASSYANVGTTLGRAVSEKFDSDVAGLFASATHSAGTSGAALTVDMLATAVQKVRAAKFGGQLWMVLHPGQVEDILQNMTGADFAGSDSMNEAMREGLVGKLFGATVIQSASVTDDNTDYTGCVWAENAFGIAMFKNLDVEISRNGPGIGNDIIASLHAKAAVVDAGRACKIISAS